MRDFLTRLVLVLAFLTVFACASGLLVWLAWNGVARVVVDVPYIPYIYCIAIAVVTDTILGTLAFMPMRTKKTFAIF
jgi:hypothetical protein